MTTQADTLQFIVQWPAGTQLNEAGEVALKVHPPNHLLAQEVPSGKGYVFAIRANIALSWVDPQDVQNLLDRHVGCGCPNGGAKYKFMYANEDDVRRWTNNGGR